MTKRRVQLSWRRLEGQTLEESEDEEQPEENEEDEAAPTRYRPADGTMSYGLTMRSTSAREVFDALRHMCPGTAADVLARAAVRLKCSKELLQASSMARTIKDHDITILKESRAYIMENSLGPRGVGAVATSRSGEHQQAHGPPHENGLLEDERDRRGRGFFRRGLGAGCAGATQHASPLRVPGRAEAVADRERARPSRGELRPARR